jgi:ATP-dependent exoDNAse (exonuclease V) beta subunit
MLQPVLELNFIHERDFNIHFNEENHTYSILNDKNHKYTSVTTWLHTHFSKFNADKIISNMMKGKAWKEGHKYWGLNADQIKSLWNQNSKLVSSSGTDLHYQIECFMNNNLLPKGYTHLDLYNHYLTLNKDTSTSISIEWNFFIDFIKDFPHLKPYRTEWIVYNEDIKLAGSIDMVYEKEDGTLAIYDWKRSKEITRVNIYNQFAITKCICHLPDTNFWHYALQLNTYRRILQDKYNKQVTELYLVRLHPENDNNSYELISIPILNMEMDDLILLLKINA